MPKYIVHHEGKFLEWSTVDDRPQGFGMDARAFRAWFQAKYGTEGLRSLPLRMDKAVQFGSSSEETLEEAVFLNRAGPDEGRLTVEDVIKFYFVLGREPKDGDVVCVPEKEEEEEPQCILICIQRRGQTLFWEGDKWGADRDKALRLPSYRAYGLRSEAAEIVRCDPPAGLCLGPQHEYIVDDA